MWSVENMFAAYERNKIMERFKRAKRAMHDEGLWVGEGGNATYGYKKVGKRKDSKIELIIEECTVVQRIFELFLEGYSTGGIAAILTTAGIAPPASKGYFSFHPLTKASWSDNSVYHILKNEKYVGRWYANRWKSSTTGSGERDRSEWIRIDLPHTQLVQEGMFQAAQAQLVANRRTAGATVTHEYLLARRCTCGICGYTINAHTATRGNKKYSYYGCNGKRDRAKRFNAVQCTLMPFQVKHVDALLWEALTRFITDPAYRQETLEHALQEHTTRHADALGMVEAADRAKARYNDEILRLTSLYTDGDIALSVFRAKKKDIESKYAAAMSVEEEYLATIQGMLTPTDIDGIHTHMDNLAREFQKLGDLAFKRRLELIEAMGITGVLTTQNGASFLSIYAHSTGIATIPLDVTDPSHGMSVP